MDISIEAYRSACFSGQLHVAQWLYSLDLSAEKEHAFRGACSSGHLLVAQWLYHMKPKLVLSADNDYAFLNAC